MLIDLRFVVPVLNSILMYLIIKYSPFTEGQAKQELVWDYFVDHQNGWLHIILPFLSIVFVIFVKPTISVTVFTEPVMLKFGDFSSSVPLILLMTASFLFPPRVLLCAYLITCTCIWISPLPSRVFKNIISWLQRSPAFLITAQQPIQLHHFEGRHEEEEDEDIEINFFLGHA
ncbi:hypothetical protein POM88_019236 [Heracleum sosnowskyi]|uniref:Uncharacterized protein n=1 Tax=Heracleum sosnowskyi TaxID=360622 RepID=A0AAD8ITT3_9APIA|nr:hypothetical protein POM88_019236 [Heracleum sosnowskyi]